MAKRYGGKYSPNGETGGNDAPFEGRSIDAGGARANILFLPPVVLLFTSLTSDATTLAIAAGGALVLTVAAWLLREGLRAEAAYNARKVARRPAVPRKILATSLTGVGVTLAAISGGSALIESTLYGLVAAALHLAAFGIDPLRNKRMEGVDEFQQDRVARVVDEAESHLTIMKQQIERLRDRTLESRVDRFQNIARKMIRTVEEDPRDLTGARKYLGVYLMGAKDATVKFVDLYSRKKDAEARASYEALLTDLEENFAARTEKMLLDDRSDMDVEIKVLRDRLQREGVSLN